jgi:phenylalanyl-tRNA synthetase beta chain
VDLLIDRVRHYLAAVGYHEIVTSSFVSRADMERLRLGPSDRRAGCLAISNPRHGGDTLLRTLLLPSLLNVMRHNINADNHLPLRFFQWNKVFRAAVAPRDGKRHPDEDLLPDEPLLFQCGVAGRADTVHGGEPGDLFELKGVLETIAELGVLGWALVPGGAEPFLDRVAQWRVIGADGRQRGWAGRVADDVRAGFAIDLPVVVCEIELSDEMEQARASAMRFEPFARFPVVKRDLSLVVPGATAYSDVVRVVRDAGGELVANVELFDIYSGKGLPENTRALGIRLKFRSAQGSLKGGTVDHSIVQITEALAKRLAVRLRS